MSEAVSAVVWVHPVCPVCRYSFETPPWRQQDEFEALKMLRDTQCQNCLATVRVKFVEEQR